MMMMAVMSLRAKLCLWRLNSLFLHLSQLDQLSSKNFAFLYSFPKNLRNQTRLHSIGWFTTFYSTEVLMLKHCSKFIIFFHCTVTMLVEWSCKKESLDGFSRDQTPYYCPLGSFRLNTGLFLVKPNAASQHCKHWRCFWLQCCASSALVVVFSPLVYSVVLVLWCILLSVQWQCIVLSQ